MKRKRYSTIPLAPMETPKERAERLVETLKGIQWGFKFTVEATSPHNYKYVATSDDWHKAVLKAFSMLRIDTVDYYKVKK